MVEWISTKERLPGKKGQYLCYCDLGMGVTYMAVYSFTKNLSKIDPYAFYRVRESGWYYNDREYGYCTVGTVTHWMPLPKPPKEKGT